MERYLLFSGEAYYPGGGAEDFRADYATMVECMNDNCSYDQWWNILDTRTGRMFHHYDVDDNQRFEWAAGIDAGEDI